MKVIDELCITAYLESLHISMSHAVRMLEISIEGKEGCDWDLRIAKSNLEQLERAMNFVRVQSFDARQIFYEVEAI
jgi:hypothetical protein